MGRVQYSVYPIVQWLWDPNMEYETRNKASYIPYWKIGQWREVQVGERSHNRLKDKEIVPVWDQIRNKTQHHVEILWVISLEILLNQVFQYFISICNYWYLHQCRLPMLHSLGVRVRPLSGPCVNAECSVHRATLLFTDFDSTWYYMFFLYLI